MTRTTASRIKLPYLLFDGVNDYVSIPHSSIYLGANLTNGFTLSAWVNPILTGTGAVARRIFDKSDNNTAGQLGFVLAFSNSGNLNRLIFYLNVVAVYSASDSIMPDSGWHHIAVTVSSAHLVNFYIDGVLSGTANQDIGQEISTITTIYDARIGNRANATDRSMNGGIQDVRFYNVVLTTDEITNLYNKINVTRGLTAHYPLTGSANDEIAGNDGTISGATWKNRLTES